MTLESVRLVSWNVNGIRSIMSKGALQEFFASYQPDILCLQETRALEEQNTFRPEGYHCFWNQGVKKGYSGTAIFTRIAPQSHSFGLGIAEHDQEGRVVTLDFGSYYLVNVYTPNAGSELQRLDYRTQSWDAAFRAYVKGLAEKKPVVFCGDLNVAHQEIDLANPKTNTKSAGFTPEEREAFSATLAAGFVDSFRLFETGGGHYTWWSFRTAARSRNAGWRIDYFCVSESIRDHIQAAGIEAQTLGSDHCPVTMTLRLPL